ncbi:hypothetical protein EDD86DRAFT_265225 [Gorgonomyces haynaldii]|nr:hypothetical protein EDD86DRAFT_265225 [Gorgonomyces haynaldii]
MLAANQLFTRLRSVVPDCSRLSDIELSALVNSKEQSHAKQKLLAIVFNRLGDTDIEQLLEQRRQEKRNEIRMNKTSQEKIKALNDFDRLFSQVVVEKTGCGPKFLTNKAQFVKLLETVLDRIQSRKTKPRPEPIGLGDQKVAKTKAEQVEDVIIKQEPKLDVDVVQLMKENQDLKNRLQEMQLLYQATIAETSLDKNPQKAFQQLTDKKMMLLQSQIAQLKRQIDVYKDQSLFNETIKSDELKQVIKKTEYLAKTMDRSVRDRLQTQEELKSNTFHFLSDFISRERQPVSLLDVSSGKTEHLNLRHIARLETELFKLLEITTRTLTHLNVQVVSHADAHKQKLISKMTDQLQKCIQMLLSLSCLVPVAGIPSGVKEPLIPDHETVMETLNVPKKSQKHLEHLLHVYEQDRLFRQVQLEAIQEEIEACKQLETEHDTALSHNRKELEAVKKTNQNDF